VNAQRIKRNFAVQMQALVDLYFLHTLKIRLVLDNLNTNIVAALYETLEVAEARRILRWIESHYTPVHVS
jgi:hypothetical protein